MSLLFSEQMLPLWEPLSSKISYYTMAIKFIHILNNSSQCHNVVMIFTTLWLCGFTEQILLLWEPLCCNTIYYTMAIKFIYIVIITSQCHNIVTVFTTLWLCVVTEQMLLLLEPLCCSTSYYTMAPFFSFKTIFIFSAKVLHTFIQHYGTVKRYVIYTKYWATL